MSPHLLRCQGLAVDNYSVTLGRLKAGATSTFDQSGLQIRLVSRFVADQTVALRYETSGLTAEFSKMMTK